MNEEGFMMFLTSFHRRAREETERLEMIERNCVRIRREVIKLVVNNGITRVRDD